MGHHEKFSKVSALVILYGKLSSELTFEKFDQPMPGLGSMQSDIAEVLEMYDKWFSFESWRDFTLDLEDAFDLEGVCMCGCVGVQ